jgi:hypothetical protein
MICALSFINAFPLLIGNNLQTRLFASRAGCERICVLTKTLFRGNTLCISRKSGEVRAQIVRRMPKGRKAASAKKDKQKSLAENGKAQQDLGMHPWHPIYMSDFAGLSYRA